MGHTDLNPLAIDQTLVSEVACEDNMVFMSRFPDSFFDLAVVDPPYGIGDTWSKSRCDKFYSKGRIAKYQNESIPDKTYFQELFRVSKHQIIWGGNYFTEFLKPTNAWIVWNKLRDADTSYMSEGEMAWTSFNKVLRVVPFLWNGAQKCEQTQKVHPHQKPMKLYRWIYKHYGTPGCKVLDTHMGSQSSRIAAFDMRMDYYGCDSDEYYFHSGCQRFEGHIRQLKLFRSC